MSKEEFARMLEGVINDSEVADSVAAGDFTGLAKADLTDAEQALLNAAASHVEGDVSGYGYIKFDGVDGESWKIEEGEAVKSAFIKFDGFKSAFNYLQID